MRRWMVWCTRLLVLGVVAGCRREPVPVQPVCAPAPVVVDAASLTGVWVRPDGGYILEIRGVAEDGKLDVTYSNPRPIHVADATWRQSDTMGLMVLVELRDTGYPGATYRLRYQQDKDTLTGAYHQPAVDQTFDVTFARKKN